MQPIEPRGRLTELGALRGSGRPDGYLQVWPHPKRMPTGTNECDQLSPRAAPGNETGRGATRGDRPRKSLPEFDRAAQSPLGLDRSGLSGEALPLSRQKRRDTSRVESVGRRGRGHSRGSTVTTCTDNNPTDKDHHLDRCCQQGGAERAWAGHTTLHSTPRCATAR